MSIETKEEKVEVSHKTAFIITSMINSKLKSVYSSQERLDQTIRTINSIQSQEEWKEKEKGNPPFCLLVELSELTTTQKDILNKKVDKILDLSKDSKAQDYSQQKSLGDIYSTIIGCIYLKLKQPEVSNVYKISGRYYLDEKFSLEKNKKERNECKILFRKIVHNIPDYKTVCYETKLYMFKSLDKLLILLTKAIELINKRIVTDVEHAFYYLLKDSTPEERTETDCIGISGYIAPSGEFQSV